MQDFPYQFPPHADQIYRDAMEYRRLSPTDRLLAIMDLMALTESMLATSPNRDYALRDRESQEQEWQRAYRELLARHGL